MGMGQLHPANNSKVLSDGVAERAENIIDDFWLGGKSAEYREHLLAAYRDRAGEPPKRDENGAYQTPDESRMQRAWQDVAKRYDVTEGTVRSLVLKYYDDHPQYKPEKRGDELEEEEVNERPPLLIKDFNRILSGSKDNE